jgi:hypothetical protein
VRFKLVVIAVQRERKLWEVVGMAVRVSVVRILPLSVNALLADESLMGGVSIRPHVGLYSEGGSKLSGSVSDSWTSRPSGTVPNCLPLSWRKYMSLRSLLTSASRDKMYPCCR